MSDWTAGYVADIGYTYGYYNELNPLRLRLAFLRAGLVPPAVATACELGFGQGLSVAMHAAASTVKWHGTDFNPAQAGFAQELAAVSGSGAQLFDASFEEFFARDDLPMFDYIGLHGIWTWVSDDNRARIVDFVRRKLKVGGVMFVSYNTLPGWAPFMPLRHLMTQHADTMSAPGIGMVKRIDAALQFAGALFEVEPAYATVNPGVRTRFDKMKEQNRNYMAHEYFNRDWHPMYFSDMARWLAPAKVEYACSAFYLDHFDNVNLNDKQRDFLAAQPDAYLREGLRDYVVNQQFRRDYWVKGARTLTPLQRQEQLGSQRVMLVTPRSDVPEKLPGPRGEITLKMELFGPVLDVLASKPSMTVREVFMATKENGMTLDLTTEVLMILASSGHVAPVQDEAERAACTPSVRKLNAWIMRHSRSNQDIIYLASPVTGGGVPINRFSQLFVLGTQAGIKHPLELAQFTWNILSAQNQKLVHEGKVLESREDNIKDLARRAELFVEKLLPMLQRLEIV